jgi:hypothetical protein
MARSLNKVRLGFLLVGLSAISVSGSGCAERPAERLVPVSGKVTVNGKALPAGKVIFHPDAQKGNRTQQEPRGTIDNQGVYRLSTGDRDGAPLGWYRVAVFAMKPGTDDGARPPEWLANQRYTDARTSGLSIEVVENSDSGAYSFQLNP